MVTNVNAAGSKVSPIGGAGLDGTRVVYVEAAKATQNDTVTLTNVKQILSAQVMVTDATTKVVDTFTITETAPTVINLTGAVVGTVHIMAIVK